MLAIITFIATLVVLFSVSCVSIQKDNGDEPLWRPDVFLYSPAQDGRCKFVDGKGYVLDCDEPLMHDYYLAPLTDLVTLKSKLQQCETWR